MSDPAQGLTARELPPAGATRCPPPPGRPAGRLDAVPVSDDHRIDLVSAERLSAAVDQLIGVTPGERDVGPASALGRWLQAVAELLPQAGEHDRARLLQARAALRSDADRQADASVAQEVHADAVLAGELFERQEESLPAASSFAVAAASAARAGWITLALESAVRALTALSRAEAGGRGADRDALVEAQLATRLGALCRQLFDYPRALRFAELALSAVGGPNPDQRGSAATVAVAELLLARASELAADDDERVAALGRAETLAHHLIDQARPAPFRRVQGPRLLAEVLCAQGRPGSAWPLLLGVRGVLAARPAWLPVQAGLLASVHLAAGRCLLQLGRPTEAVAELDDAVRLLDRAPHGVDPYLADLLAALQLRSAARQASGDVSGALADSRRLSELLWDRQRRQVGSFLDQVWSRAGAEGERRDLQDRTQALLQRAEQDPLTGLANRRGVERFCAQLHPGDRLCLVLLDLDHFKRVNDRHGHATGDAVLRRLADLLTRAVRSMDMVARWGGEEFLIALPGGSGLLGTDAASRFCHRVRLYPWHELAPDLALTVSAGVAVGPVAELEDVLGRADAALYAAKRAGRDRAVIG